MWSTRGATMWDASPCRLAISIMVDSMAKDCGAWAGWLACLSPTDIYTVIETIRLQLSVSTVTRLDMRNTAVSVRVRLLNDEFMSFHETCSRDKKITTIRDRIRNDD